MKKFQLPTISKQQKCSIPYEEIIEAIARVTLQNEDSDQVVSEMYTKHNLKPPKHGNQALGAFRRRVLNKLEKEDPLTLQLLEKHGFPKSN